MSPHGPRIYLLIRDIIAKSTLIGVMLICCCKTPEPTPDGRGLIIERNYRCSPNDEDRSAIVCPNLSGQEAIDAANEFEETFIKSKGGNDCMRAMIEKCIDLLRKKASSEQKQP